MPKKARAKKMIAEMSSWYKVALSFRMLVIASKQQKRNDLLFKKRRKT